MPGKHVANKPQNVAKVAMATLDGMTLPNIANLIQCSERTAYRMRATLDDETLSAFKQPYLALVSTNATNAMALVHDKLIGDTTEISLRDAAVVAGIMHDKHSPHTMPVGATPSVHINLNIGGRALRDMIETTPAERVADVDVTPTATGGRCPTSDTEVTE